MSLAWKDSEVAEDKSKKIIFSVSENDKAKFKLQLQYDSLTQAQLLRETINGYINKDEDFMKFVARIKINKKTQSKPQMKKVEKNLQQAKQTKNIFALDDNEVENIFDILEKEHPDL